MPHPCKEHWTRQPITLSTRWRSEQRWFPFECSRRNTRAVAFVIPLLMLQVAPIVASIFLLGTFVHNHCFRSAHLCISEPIGGRIRPSPPPCLIGNPVNAIVNACDKLHMMWPPSMGRECLHLLAAFADFFQVQEWVRGKYNSAVAFRCRYVTVTILHFQGHKNLFPGFTNFLI